MTFDLESTRADLIAMRVTVNEAGNEGGSVTVALPRWQDIGTAPRDGKTIFAENWQTGQRGMVSFNSNGEWEMVNGLNNTPMGVGFYPTHWMPLPEPPK